MFCPQQRNMKGSEQSWHFNPRDLYPIRLLKLCQGSQVSGISTTPVGHLEGMSWLKTENICSALTDKYKGIQQRLIHVPTQYL